MKTTEEVWLERVREWKASGLTAKQFAEGKPYKASSLVWRQWQLQRDHHGSSAKAKRDEPRAASRGQAHRRGAKGRGARRSPALSMPMVEVVRRSAVARPSAQAPQAVPVFIEVGQARIEVGAGFDAMVLRDVVRALKGAA